MAPPARFGKYFLTERIATGGMAEIYLGKLYGPGGFEKQLVIKQIHPELADDPRFVELLVAEAKTLVSLSHGNIVPIYELGVVDDTYFIAMEYVDGPTLAELSAALADRGDLLDPALAVHIVAELLEGLDYAHRKGDGLVHRDLSPRNVMLSREGEIKLLDFGIALPMGATPRAATGSPAGSVPYMSPEQVRCEILDPRSDLFSAGVLLWELLTGSVLFGRDDADATLQAVLEADIAAPSTVRGDLAGDLDAICRRALARDRDARYQSAGELLRDLRRYLYSIDALLEPGAISALVARLCPPVVRPSEDDGATAAAAAASQPVEGTTPMQRTRPMEGRRRARSVQTFATRADFAAATNTAQDGDDDAPPVPAAPPRRRRQLVAAAAVTTAALAVLVAIALPSNVDAPAVAAATEPRLDSDSAATTEPRPTTDVSAQPAAAADASEPAARRQGDRVADAGPAADRARRNEAATDRAAASRDRDDPVAANRTARGHGTLRVGANPWGDVYLDGKRLGRAPGSWQISSGRHELEVRNGDAAEHFAIDVEPDEIESLGVVDFTR